jgi:hypothetical protein
MNRIGTSRRCTWLAAIVVAGWLFLPLSGVAFGQEPATPAGAAAEATTAADQETQPETTKGDEPAAD